METGGNTLCPFSRGLTEAIKWQKLLSALLAFWDKKVEVRSFRRYVCGEIYSPFSLISRFPMEELIHKKENQ